MTQREKTIYRVTWVGFGVNAALSALKLAAGILGRSSAMVADAIHSISDFITDIVVLVCVRLAARPQDERYDYGAGKFETLGTIVVGLSLFAVALHILVDNAVAIKEILDGNLPPRPGLIALGAAALSIAAKEGLFWYTLHAAKKVKAPAMEANAWHHRSDALSSIATLVGIGCAFFLGDKWRILDPLAALFVGALIIKVAYDLVTPGLQELLERSLPKEAEDHILDIIRTEFPQVDDPHKLKTRRIGTGVAIQIDIRLDGEMTVNQSHAIAEAIEERLTAEFGHGTHVVVHVDPKKPLPHPTASSKNP